MFLLDTGMSWEFFFPVSVGDLVKTGGINQYVVQDVVPPKHLPSSLNSKPEKWVIELLLIFINGDMSMLNYLICFDRV